MSLPSLAERLEAVLTTETEAFEVILVNDGSSDESWETVCGLAAQYPWVRGINLMRNFGQHNALLCGVRVAQHEIIVTIDDDLQHPPEEIPKLFEKLNEDNDAVYGTPDRVTHGLWRDLASAITKMALRSAMGVEVARQVSAFRAFRTPLREAFANYQSPFVSIDVLLTWGTTRFGAVQVRHDERTLGASNYTFWKLVNHAVNMMTGFSTLPLRVASFVGFGFTVFGLLVLAYVLIGLLVYGRVVKGFAFTASIIAVFSGAQLFALGIIGEYLARIHFRAMDRPPYVSREDTAERTDS
jgi:undecaprenyl-phosphate 4-deoxy-4-formamido-L-arabinose transferase